jgi:S1-C subfamily serine protease
LIGNSRHKLKFALAAVLTAAALHAPAAASAGVQSSRKDSTVSAEARALISQAITSTGLILVRNSNDASAPRPRGSAVVVRGDGVIATNLHVVTSERTNRLYDEILLSISREGDPIGSGTRYLLKALLVSKEYDLALLRVESDAAGNPLPRSFTFPAIEIGDSRRIKLLEDLFIIGFPEKGGSTVTVNRGVVEGKDILGNWIKTDARVIHGNSGGAAVNSEGKLIGIPTKVVADEQPVDKDGDGFPDEYRRYGAVGFLRPAHLVGEMLGQLDHQGSERQLSASTPTATEVSRLITVRGVVKSTGDGKPIAGALVGLLPLGETSVTGSTLLTWGSTNGEGEFALNRPVPPGKYTLKAKALAKQPYTRDVEIVPGSPALVVQMNPTSDQ